MARRARPPLDHREAAARFRLLADIEPWPNLRQHFRRLAAEHGEATADDPAEPECGGPAPTPKRRWLVLIGDATARVAQPTYPVPGAGALAIAPERP